MGMTRASNFKFSPTHGLNTVHRVFHFIQFPHKLLVEDS